MNYHFHARHCLLAALLAGLLARLARAQAEPAQDETVQLPTVEVTGSNIKMTASEADKSALPLEFIPENKFTMGSGDSIPTFLRNEPIVSGIVTSPYNDGQSGASQGGISGLNLRGIGQQYTLVLVDGRRVGGEGQPDLGAIPTEALGSIEILKSGSSAVFGSDAVAGVVNLKLKDDFAGAEAVVSYGNTTDKDAHVVREALIFGEQTERLKFVVSIGTQNEGGIDKWDREITSSRDFRRWGGIDRRTTTRGLINRIVLPSGQIVVVNYNQLHPGQTGTSAADYIPFDPNVEAYSNNSIGVSPAIERINGHWHLAYAVFGKRLELFATGFWDNHKSDYPVKEARADVTVPATNPYNPFGTSVTVDYLMGEVPPVRELWNTTVFQTITGARGELGEFTYDTAFSRYSSVGHESWVGDYPTSLLQAATNRTDASAFNPLGYFANTPAQLAGLSVTKHYDQISTTDIADFKLGGPIVNLPGGESRFSAGAEHRKVDFATDPDYAWETLPTAINNSTMAPSHGGRDIDAYFGEVRAPLYRNADGSGLSGVEVGGATRTERYSDFGSATVGQANLRVATVADSLIFRASWAQAFHAPTVANLTQSTVSNQVSGLYDPVLNGVTVATVITGGNPTLQPEKANTYDAGAIYTPKNLSGITVRCDYWAIRLNDAIITPNPQAVLNGTSPGGSLTRNPVTLAPTIDGRLSNGGDVDLSGLDTGLSYELPKFGFGKLTFDYSETYGLEFKNIVGATTTSYLGDYSATYGPLPRLRSTLGALWEKSGWSASAFLHYMKGVRETALPPPLPPTRVTEGTATLDLQVKYAFGPHCEPLGGALRQVEVYVGSENLTNTKPVFLASAATGWDQSLGDIRGRYLYTGLRKRF